MRIRSIVVLLAVCTALAQTPTGTIAGVVEDSSAAVVPRAEVTIQNLSSGLTRSTVTNETGVFQIPLLPVGAYSVTTRANGFKKSVRSNVRVEVQQTVNLVILLEVGETLETVVVREEVAMLETQTSAVGEVITNEQVTNLPVNERNFLQLTFLTPFAVGGGRAQQSIEAAGRGAPEIPSTGGLRPEDNNYQIDGFDNLEGGRHTYAVAPAIDTVSEFRVQSGIAPAEYGRGAGTFINVVTQSGGNRFHGTLYEFLRNDDLDSRNFFAAQVSHLKRNQFGGALGGPVLKNKLFFFANYEAFRERSAGAPVVGRVPTADERAGNFNNVATVDPLNNNTPFPSNRIPDSRINSISRGFLSLWPLPNNGTVPASNFRFDRPSAPKHRNIFTGRGDYTISAKDNIFVRYLANDDNTSTPPRFANGIGGTKFDLKASTIGGHYNHVFSPSAINDFGFGWTHFENNNYNHLSYGEDLITKGGITNIISATDPVFTGSPGVSIPGYLGLGEATPQDRKTNTGQATNSLTLVRGSHQLKIGGVYRHSETNHRFSSGAGSHTFANRYSRDPFADYLLALPSNVVKTVRRTFWDTTLPYLAGYVSDDWRVTPRLTVNIGLRYEVEGAYRTPRRDQIGFDLKTGTQLISEHISERQYFEDFYRTIRPDIPVKFLPFEAPYDTDMNNFAPRLGIAYRMNDRMVIRTGYGINFSAPQFPAMANANVFTPNDLRGTWASDSNAPRITLPGGVVLAAGWNPEGAGGAEATVRAPTPLGSNAFVQRDFPYAYVQQWTFGIQTQLNSKMILETTYLGARGVHLMTHMNQNFTTPAPGSVQVRLPYPQYIRINTRLPMHNSYYHGLGVKLERRFFDGFMLLSSYTYSKAIDTASGFQNEGSQWNDPRNILGSSKGPSIFDARQRLVNSFAYELPFGPGKKWGSSWPGAARHILGGWGVRGIVQFQTGFYWTPDMTLARTNHCANSCLARPDRIADGNLPEQDRTITRYWSREAFVLPTTAAPRYGNAGRGILAAPGIANWDLGVYKSFQVRESLRAEFRYEAFNAFNHTQFGTPTINMEDAAFGSIRSARDPRISQFVLKLAW